MGFILTIGTEFCEPTFNLHDYALSQNKLYIKKINIDDGGPFWPSKPSYVNNFFLVKVEAFFLLILLDSSHIIKHSNFPFKHSLTSAFCNFRAVSFLVLVDIEVSTCSLYVKVRWCEVGDKVVLSPH
jgi:hypothetical protein